MSFRLKSTLFRVGLIYSIIFWAAFSHAAVEKVGLKLNGHPIPILGKKYCPKEPNADENIEVALTPELAKTSNFRYLFGKKSEKSDTTKTTKEKHESGCRSTFPESVPLDKQKFDVGKPTIPAKEFLTPNACDNKNGDSGELILCIYDSFEKNLVAYAEFAFNTRVASIKEIEYRNALNGEITFTVDITPGSGAVKIETCCVPDSEKKELENDVCPDKFKHISSTQNVTITGLKNGVLYHLKVRIPEEYNGNGKWWDKPISETPVAATFPLDSYNGNGGDFEFSCTQNNSSSLVFLAIVLIALIFLRRRNLPKTPTNLLLTLMVLCLVIRSENGYATLGQMNVGISGAMYRPDLDSETLSSGEVFPFYKCYFRKKTSDKEGPINPLLGFEIDWHLWDGFGSLLLGFGTSYTFAKGHPLKSDSNKKPDCDKPLENANVYLHMYQLRPQLTYIFNPYVEYFPLAPYVRAALVGQGYSFYHKNASSVTVNGITHKPNGFRFGYQAAVGLMLMLDFLEPGAVRTARGEGLFDHVYLKAELSYLKIDDFGQKGYQFSAKDVMGTSLPFMWTFGLVFELPQ